MTFKSTFFSIAGKLLLANAAVLVAYLLLRRWTAEYFSAGILDEILLWAFGLVAILLNYGLITKEWIRNRQAGPTNPSAEDATRPSPATQISANHFRKHVLLAVLGVLSAPILVLSASQLIVGEITTGVLVLPIVIAAVVATFAAYSDVSQRSFSRHLVSVLLLTGLGAFLNTSVSSRLGREVVHSFNFMSQALLWVQILLPILIAVIRISRLRQR
jgi:hypothetical protein